MKRTQNPRVEVLLTPEDYTALVELARKECRLPGDQLRWLLRRELSRLNPLASPLLTEPQPLETP